MKRQQMHKLQELKSPRAVVPCAYTTIIAYQVTQDIEERYEMKNWLLAGLWLLALLGGVQAQESNARVIRMWEKLNMRTQPSRDALVVAELPGLTPLIVTGRSADNTWAYAQTVEGAAGWVAAGYVEMLSTDFYALPVIDSLASTAPPGPAEAPSPPTEAPTENGMNGSVNSSLLNLRAAPSTNAGLLARLPQNTELIISGRSADSAWYFVRLVTGGEGWVFARYVSTALEMTALPVAETIANPAVAASADTPSPAPTFFTLGATAWQTFANGQELGNRRDVFSKVGDSITFSELMYRPLGFGAYDLGGFGYLQTTIDFFSRTIARDNNSFTNSSLAAFNGWTTDHVLNPANADPQFCQPGESPLACEYRNTRPAVALIMLGTNDVVLLSPEHYAANLRMILQVSMDSGVIPVLSTIPPRRDSESKTDLFNALIVQVAAEMGASLWDYGAVMKALPDYGLSADGVHPSAPPGGFGYAANFSGDGLKYGYVLRNLTALQVLDTLRQQVLGG